MIVTAKDSFDLLIERDFPQYCTAQNNQERYDVLADIGKNAKGKFLASIIGTMRGHQLSERSFVTEKVMHQLEFNPETPYCSNRTEENRLFFYTPNLDSIQNALDFFHGKLFINGQARLYSRNRYKDFPYDVDTILSIVSGIAEIDREYLQQKSSNWATIAIIYKYTDSEKLRQGVTPDSVIDGYVNEDIDRITELFDKIRQKEKEISEGMDQMM